MYTCDLNIHGVRVSRKEEGMEIMKGKTIKLKEDITLVSVEESAALLDVEKRCYYEPNETAFFLLKLMEGGCLYEDMEAALVSRFDIAEEAVQLDLDNFIGELLKLGIVESGEQATARGSAGKAEKGKKPYQTPLLEHESEIAVASAVSAVTPPDE